MRGMAALLSIDEALARVLARARPLESERVPLAEAAERVLAEDVVARVDLPPFASSAMDGFAIRAADVPGRLPVVHRIAAGLPAERALRDGEAMEISTGGAVPDGADSVVQIELVVEKDNEIEVAAPVRVGANVRPPGGDIRAGDPLLGAGTALGDDQVGAIAAAGVTEVSCARRPSVTVLSTGTELRQPGVPLGPGQIYESNGPMLAAALGVAGALVAVIPPVLDDEDAHREALARGLEADVLVTSGGVSVGPHDLVRRVLSELGVREDFWGVSVRPGKPLAFGSRDDTLVFGLPGNPVSALVGVELFVRPALRALQGLDPGPHYERGRLAVALRPNERRDELARARRRREGDEVVLEPVTGQESHMIARAAGADALVFVPRGDGELPAGTVVRYLQLR